MADSIFTQMGSVIKNELETQIGVLETNTNTSLNTKLNTSDALTPVAVDNKIITQADVKPSGLFEQGLF